MYRNFIFMIGMWSVLSANPEKVFLLVEDDATVVFFHQDIHTPGTHTNGSCIIPVPAGATVTLPSTVEHLDISGKGRINFKAPEDKLPLKSCYLHDAVECTVTGLFLHAWMVNLEHCSGLKLLNVASQKNLTAYLQDTSFLHVENSTLEKGIKVIKTPSPIRGKTCTVSYRNLGTTPLSLIHR